MHKCTLLALPLFLCSAVAVHAGVPTAATLTGEIEAFAAAPGGRGIVVASAGHGLVGIDAKERRTTVSKQHGATLAPLGDEWLLLVNQDDSRLKVIGAQGAIPVPPAQWQPPFAASGLCTWRVAADHYGAFVLDGDGLAQQWALVRNGTRWTARAVRTLVLGPDTTSCAVDADSGTAWFAEPALGLWRYTLSPEAELQRSVFTLRDLGVAALPAIAPYGEELLLLDNESARVRALHRSSHAIRNVLADQRLQHAEAIAVSGEWLYAGGETAATFSRWQLPVAIASVTVSPQLPAVTAAVETTAVELGGDAIDDPAIWRHPGDDRLSLVLATHKRLGLHVYDLEGRLLQTLPVGRVNNVDLRDGFAVGGRRVSLVVASNRTTRGLSAWHVDAATRQLVSLTHDTLATGIGDPYGVCLYHERQTDAFYAFVNGTDGVLKQFRLFAGSTGRLQMQQVREIRLDSQPEGCVVDDVRGELYVGEEDVGVWRLDARADGGSNKTLVAKVGERLKADVEGLALYESATSRFLIVSSQGNDSYVVYRLRDTAEFVGAFRIGPDVAAGIDGASETDGLAFAPGRFGATFPDGLLVVQDGRNVMPEQGQNLKLVSWLAVKKLLDLP